jgi:hypothetical protein
LRRLQDPASAQNLPLVRDGATLSMRMQPQTSNERRLVRKDRRGPGPAVPPTLGERRLGERRQLPRSRWHQWPSLLASAALGVVAAALMQSAPAPVLAARPEPAAELAGVIAANGAANGAANEAANGAANEGASVGASEPLPVHTRFSLREAAALRDAAQRLTPAAVALDEQARLYWTPLRGELDAAALDVRTPLAVREELGAARSALERLGL